ncbi:hypothetical protein NL676_015790 [Syzygium grande]|nr:hypothetical protein NL676_015790 [Syzygium grande]
MKRGDGGGSNALSTGLAGFDFVYLWDPVNFHGFLSITVRCGTFVAIGGRVDWFDAISSFSTSPASETEGSDECSSLKGDCQQLPGSSFSLNLVDTGLSYEPYLKNLMVTSPIADLGFGHSSVKSSRDDSSELELLGGTYSVQCLDKIGYVKVAWEALILENLWPNCRDGTLWELECSNSHIDVGTCHASTLARIQLVTQLQQLFAPDLEESVVHLWVHSSSANAKIQALVIGLMDEIHEDAFLSDGSRTCQHDSESNEESFLGEKCDFDTAAPETASQDLFHCVRSFFQMVKRSTNTSCSQQKFDIKPFSVRVDYTPQHVDLAALGGGKYVELVNPVPWKARAQEHELLQRVVVQLPCGVVNFSDQLPLHLLASAQIADEMLNTLASKRVGSREQTSVLSETLPIMLNESHFNSSCKSTVLLTAVDLPLQSRPV